METEKRQARPVGRRQLPFFIFPKVGGRIAYRSAGELDRFALGSRQILQLRALLVPQERAVFDVKKYRGIRLLLHRREHGDSQPSRPGAFATMSGG